MSLRKRGHYDGPVCYVPFDHEGPDGKKLKGGWHYSTRVHRKYGEIPAHPLHLNVEGDEPYYEYATRPHRSWADKNSGGVTIPLGD